MTGEDAATRKAAGRGCRYASLCHYAFGFAGLWLAFLRQKPATSLPFRLYDLTHEQLVLLEQACVVKPLQGLSAAWAVRLPLTKAADTAKMMVKMMRMGNPSSNRAPSLLPWLA
jgi:hypothetical protein